MRLFLAVPVAPDVREALAAMQARLKAGEPSVRWVEPANFHLTVKFLGDQDDDRLPEIEEVAAEVAAVTPAFTLTVRGAGAFPKRGGPLKTLWAGVTEGKDEWRALALRAEEPLTAFGVVREGGLVPHVTLGRVKSAHGIDGLREALAAEAETDCGTQAADRLVLMRSMLDPRGAIYTPLAEWPLLKSTD
jgi:2'-5' RNA ligase